MSVKLPLDIRPVQVEELDELRRLAQETFIAAFAAHNSAEDMDAYVSRHFSSAYFEQLYLTPGSSFFLAYEEEKAIAYLKLNIDDAQSEQSLTNSIEIERIYVHEAHQGKGYGQVLLDFAVNYGRQLQKTWIWLGVWEQNHGAIRFYERHGFTTFSQHDFYLGSDLQVDWLMKRKL